MSLSTTGLLTGTPTAGGIFSITVIAMDAESITGSQTYSLTIHPPTITVSPSGAVSPRPASAVLTSEFRGAGRTPALTPMSSTGTLPSRPLARRGGCSFGTPSAAAVPTPSAYCDRQQHGNRPLQRQQHHLFAQPG